MWSGIPSRPVFMCPLGAPSESRTMWSTVLTHLPFGVWSELQRQKPSEYIILTRTEMVRNAVIQLQLENLDCNLLSNILLMPLLLISVSTPCISYQSMQDWELLMNGSHAMQHHNFLGGMWWLKKSVYETILASLKQLIISYI